MELGEESVRLPIRSLQSINPVVSEESTDYITDPEDDDSDTDFILADTEESVDDTIVNVNGQTWEVKESIPIDSRFQRQPNALHTALIRGGSLSRRPLDYFNLMWPIAHFNQWMEATNANLKAKVEGGANEKHHRPTKC